jgi:HlyD family secretion protein
VRRGISDEEYVEIVDGLQEGQTVVSGGYKAINRELEEGKKVIIDNSPVEKKEKP